MLGAPGALAARLGGATGGVRGVASAAAAALLRSLSAWAGSLARNLDLLAGDEEHARRAAAARRRPPPSFVAGLVAGITNFAINILGKLCLMLVICPSEFTYGNFILISTEITNSIRFLSW